MPATSGSGESIPAPEPRVPVSPFVKVVTTLATAAVLATAGTLWAHESRIVIGETQRVAHKEQHETLKETLDEIRGDVKALLAKGNK